jgi:hypothetical protein
MIETHDQEICSLEVEIDRLQARAAKLEKDLAQARAGCYACEPVAIENVKLQARVEELVRLNTDETIRASRAEARVRALEGDLNIMRLQRDATHVSRRLKCAATEQEDKT